MLNTLPPSSRSSSQWPHWLVFLLLGALLFLAPLVRGGNREIALSVLLAIGLAVLAVVCALASQRLTLSRVQPSSSASLLTYATAPRHWWWMVLALAFSPLLVGLLQLVPVGSTWWAQMAGRDVYLPAVTALHNTSASSLPLSLHPAATWAALWATVPASAALIAALLLPQQHIHRLLAILVGAGIVQIIIAIAQFAQGPQSFFYFGLHAQGFVGTFANRNHLANFLAMMLPLCLYFLLPHKRLHQLDHGFTSSQVVRAAAVSLVGFALLLVILSTQSRGGLLSSTAVLLLGMLVYAAARRHKPSLRLKLGGVAVFVLFAVLALGSVELEQIGNRLEAERLQTDAQTRTAYALATLDAARAFWPWGSGIGTFESVFPRFQPSHVVGYVNHAHNDYVQLLMELGAAAIVIAALFMVLCLRQIAVLSQDYRAAGRFTHETAQRGLSGIGCLALLLHSWVEFNMHIPALAITAAFLFGVFLRPLNQPQNAQRSRGRRAD